MTISPKPTGIDLQQKLAGTVNRQSTPGNRAIALVMAGEPLQAALDVIATGLSVLGGEGCVCEIMVSAGPADQPIRTSGLDGIEPLLQSAVGPDHVVAIERLLPVAADDAREQGVALRAVARGYRACLHAPVFLEGTSVQGTVSLYFATLPAVGDVIVAEAITAAELVGLAWRIRMKMDEASKADKSLAALASSIPGVVYQRAVSPQGDIRYTYISESAFDLFGVTADTILSDPEALFQHYDADYRKSFREKLIRASREMTTWDVEATIRHPDGSLRYTHALARPQREPDGTVLWTGVILDATRIKKAELAAAAAEVRTREAIVESLSQGLLMFDGDDRLTLRNSHFLKLYPAMADIAVVGASYEGILRAELDPGLNPGVLSFDANNELIDRLLRHGEAHMAYERRLANDHFILVNEYRTAENETVVLYTDISEMKRREHRIEHLAHHDALTGLANRVLFRERLDEAISDHVIHDRSVGVMCLDLDRFKTVNDTLGHQVGDVLLRQVAERIQGCLRDEDIPCRLGGDEFAIIVHNVNSHETLTSLAWRLQNAMAKPFNLAGHSIVTGVSIGIALSGADGEDAENLLRNADLALYRAKSDGRGTFRFFEAEMDEKAQERRLMEIALRAAIACNELELHYQPLVDAHTSHIVGAEALLRWNRPGHGYIPPLTYVSLAEETGLIVEIGLWVLRTACRDAATWPGGVRIAVNISPAQLRNPDFAKLVMDIVKESGLDPTRLELEITESMLLRNTDQNLKILGELKDFGVRISMDDFGTGYSSLGNLRAFPFDKIKIDKSFIGDLNKSADAAAIIRAVLALGRSLGMTTTAEGVETRDQLAYLRAEGCLEVQGHYFAKALTGDHMSKVLAMSSEMGMRPGMATNL